MKEFKIPSIDITKPDSTEKIKQAGRHNRALRLADEAWKELNIFESYEENGAIILWCKVCEVLVARYDNEPTIKRVGLDEQRHINMEHNK